MDPKIKKKFETEWANQCQQIKRGMKGKYCINRSKLICRDNSGLTFKGIRAYESSNRQILYQQVIIKEYYTNKQQNLKLNQEVLFSGRNQKELELRLKTIQFFPAQKINAFYHVTQSFQHSLEEKSTQNYEYFRNQQQLQTLCLNISQILQFLHFEKEKQALVHRNINPTNIVKKKTQGKIKYCLRQYCYAVVCKNYDSSRGQINEYNYSYQAPQVKNITSGQEDVWSFGCVLYEVLSGTERLIQSEAYYKSLQNQKSISQYIQQRMLRLKCKLQRYRDNLKINFWLDFVFKCLTFDNYKRKNSKDIFEVISRKIKRQQLLKVPQILANTKSSPKEIQTDFFQQITFQTIRLTILFDKMMTMFNQMYYSSVKLTKFQFYVILRLGSNFFLRKYSKTKQTIKCYYHDKYGQFKAVQGNQQKNIVKIRQKSIQKIKKYMKQQVDKDLKSFYQQVINEYPQILAQSLNQIQSARVLEQFCFDIRHKADQSIFQPIGQMIFYLKSIQDYPQLASKSSDINHKQALVTLNMLKLNRYLKGCINKYWVGWILQKAPNTKDLMQCYVELRSKQTTEPS